MAISTKNPSGLKLKFQTGTDPITQKVIVKTKTYSNLKPSASNDDVYEVGEILASLQGHSLLEIAKIDNTTLSA
ncbi:DUF1659 domain-containing protein [Romboutsia lituseburensis]|uniref:DUF1659 domain-containing protein n=1 Tax=Romboutsia lituseburensis DSM 797 TaxID=1121325 RepID=A0A1G9MPJ3_9FIRM|nr:DUF1659 domain-containing protein [Romboutsia lituseburensis]MCR8744276.1 DUF1659 domain-containing protein [Romboutsia lituseburensis]CEH34390.1 Protein of unknown function (DUF1659) [Romboutsia lituseburensis]SDL75575.1 Protein of unknown function [Romboutsia lituseburensis DSM 797]